jgi:hypothetical protein
MYLSQLTGKLETRILKPPQSIPRAVRTRLSSHSNGFSVCVCVCGWFRHSDSLRLRLAPKPIRFRISPRQQGSDGPVTYHVSWLPLFLFFPRQPTSADEQQASSSPLRRRFQTCRHVRFGIFLHRDSVAGMPCSCCRWAAIIPNAWVSRPSTFFIVRARTAFSLRHSSPLLLGQAPGHLGSPTTVPQLTRPFTPSPSRLCTLPLAASPISQPVQLLALWIDVVAPSNYMGKCLGPQIPITTSTRTNAARKVPAHPCRLHTSPCLLR